MSIQHPGSPGLADLISGWWPRILWRLMPARTRQTLTAPLVEVASLTKRLSIQQQLADHYEARALALQVQRDRAEVHREVTNRAYRAALQTISDFEASALPTVPRGDDENR